MTHHRQAKLRERERGVGVRGRLEREGGSEIGSFICEKGVEEGGHLHMEVPLMVYINIEKWRGSPAREDHHGPFSTFWCVDGSCRGTSA